MGQKGYKYNASHDMPATKKAWFFPSTQDFRRWLENNHASREVLELAFFREKSGKPSITYSEAGR
jgi:uncharacterized protein YdeI (YjbR/CyaY-like superfamily)